MALQSFNALLFLAIQKRIKEKVPEIRWIDQDLGQLEFYQERPPVSWPCVLIDFPATKFDQHSEETQWGEETISVRLAFPPFSSSSNVSPTSVKEKALHFWELEMKLYQALQGWTPTDLEGNEICQSLTRQSSATEKREDPIRVRVVTFTTAYEDFSAMPQMTSHSIEIELDLE